MSQGINNKKYQCLCGLSFISDEQLQKHIDERKDINDFKRHERREQEIIYEESFISDEGLQKHIDERKEEEIK